MRKRKQDTDMPVYLISVVSQMLEVHPQTLRIYEREGFVKPTRVNRQRLYSERDVERLHMIIELTRRLGVNRAGVDIILRMQGRLEGMQREMFEMMDLLEDDARKEFARRLRIIFGEE
jgi:MerR family transcriptional regulator, heat shock protein HspR